MMIKFKVDIKLFKLLFVFKNYFAVIKIQFQRILEQFKRKNLHIFKDDQFNIKFKIGNQIQYIDFFF